MIDGVVTSQGHGGGHRETGPTVCDRWCSDITGPWVVIDRETGHTVGDRWCSDITGPWGGHRSCRVEFVQKKLRSNFFDGVGPTILYDIKCYTKI